MPLRIFDSVLGAAGFTVVYGNHPVAVINHPFVSYLEGRHAVAFADVSDEVGILQYEVILVLPGLRPSTLEAFIRNGCDEVDSRIVGSEAENNLCCPNVNTTSHAGDECSISICYGLAYGFFKFGFDERFWLM